jgi:hypothetical protein
LAKSPYRGLGTRHYRGGKEKHKSRYSDTRARTKKIRPEELEDFEEDCEEKSEDQKSETPAQKAKAEYRAQLQEWSDLRKKRIANSKDECSAIDEFFLYMKSCAREWDMKRKAKAPKSEGEKDGKPQK